MVILYTIKCIDISPVRYPKEGQTTESKETFEKALAS